MNRAGEAWALQGAAGQGRGAAVPLLQQEGRGVQGKKKKKTKKPQTHPKKGRRAPCGGGPPRDQPPQLAVPRSQLPKSQAWALGERVVTPARAAAKNLVLSPRIPSSLRSRRPPTPAERCATRSISRGNGPRQPRRFSLRMMSLRKPLHQRKRGKRPCVA